MRPSVALSGIVQSEPKLLQLRDAVARLAGHAASICLDKVVAHHDEPNEYPLPAGADTPEQRLHRILGALPTRRRRQVFESVRPRLRPEVRRQRYGDLAAIDLRSAAPILQQVRPRAARLLPRLEPAEAARIRTRIRGLLPAAQPQLGTTARFVMRLHQVECEEKTRELFEGRDEMRLTAFGFEEDGDQRTVEAVDLGQYRQGEVRQFSGTELASFDLPADTTLPRLFIALFDLAEIDPDSLALDAVGFVTSVVLTVVGMILAPEAALLILILGSLTAEVFAVLLVLSVDEPFLLSNVFEFVASLKDEFPQERIIISRNRRGRYALTYSWSLE